MLIVRIIDQFFLLADVNAGSFVGGSVPVFDLASGKLIGNSGFLVTEEGLTFNGVPVVVGEGATDALPKFTPAGLVASRITSGDDGNVAIDATGGNFSVIGNGSLLAVDTEIRYQADNGGLGNSGFSAFGGHTKVGDFFGNHNSTLLDVDDESGVVAMTAANGLTLNGLPFEGGAGDVVGPASATNNHIPQFDGASGKLLKDGLALDADGSLAANSNSRVATQAAVKTYVDAHAGGAPDYDDMVLAESPVIYLKLDETSGTAMADSSGNGLNGTLAGSGYTLGVTGLPQVSGDKALTGSADVAITIADNSLLDVTGAITLECWVKKSSFTSVEGLLIAKASEIFSGNASTTVYTLAFLSGNLYLMISDGSTANEIHVDVQGLAGNEWHLITGTWTGKQGALSMQIMVDGQVLVSGSAGISAMQSTSDAVSVCGRSGSGNGYEHFQGSINEVVVYPNHQSLPRHLARYNRGMLGR